MISSRESLFRPRIDILRIQAYRLFTGFTASAKFLWDNEKSRGLRSSALSVNDVVSEIPRIGKLPERNPLGTHARDSRFETLKNAGKMRFSSSTGQVSSKSPRPSRSISSRAVVNWRGDFPNASLFDRPIETCFQLQARNLRARRLFLKFWLSDFVQLLCLRVTLQIDSATRCEDRTEDFVSVLGLVLRCAGHSERACFQKYFDIIQ